MHDTAIEIEYIGYFTTKQLRKFIELQKVRKSRLQQLHKRSFSPAASLESRLLPRRICVLDGLLPEPADAHLLPVNGYFIHFNLEADYDTLNLNLGSQLI